MDLVHAMKAAACSNMRPMRIYRVDGPEFVLDADGLLTLVTPECLYIGDILDLTDWRAEPTGAENGRN